MIVAPRSWLLAAVFAAACQGTAPSGPSCDDAAAAAATRLPAVGGSAAADTVRGWLAQRCTTDAWPAAARACVAAAEPGALAACRAQLPGAVGERFASELAALTARLTATAAAPTPHDAVPGAASFALAVHADGGYTLAGTPVAAAEIAAALRALVARTPTVEIVIEPDATVGHADVVRALEFARGAGVKRLAIGQSIAIP